MIARNRHRKTVVVIGNGMVGVGNTRARACPRRDSTAAHWPARRPRSAASAGLIST